MIRGLYFPTEKNRLVRDLYPQLGFSRAVEVNGGQAWLYDIAGRGPIKNRYIELTTLEDENGRAPAIAASL
jgi:predicted enzyme involved in methoxymalonyl-ACP biosynthesis